MSGTADGRVKEEQIKKWMERSSVESQLLLSVSPPTQFFSADENRFFLNKVCIINVMGSVVNNRIERTWRKEREENGRGQNGGVIEKA